MKFLEIDLAFNRDSIRQAEFKRKMNMSSTRCMLARVVVLLASLSALGADWPEYRHDAGRSGFTPEPISAVPHLQWTYVPRNPPMPAWQDPVREYNLLDFDYSFQTVVAGGLVYFGSSADCLVYALDEKTGKVVWTFPTDGPIRFAPAVSQDKVIAASDDGYVYCLSAKEGRLLWKHRVGPSGDMIIGNGRMISRWPLRSGLAVADGIVHCSAGMWPMDKTFMCGLKVEDGSEVWKTEPPEFGPQGYLALNSRFLYVPAGRAPMWVMDRKGGRARATHPFGRSGPMAREDVVITGPQTHSGNENLPIAGSPTFAPRAASVWAWTPGMERVIKPAANEKTAYAFGASAVYLAGGGKVAARDFGFNQKWEVAGPQQAYATIVADRTIIVGGDKVVTLHSADDGKTLVTLPVDGQARGLAAAGGRLYVSLDSGRIVCFGAEAVAAPPVVSSPAPNAAAAPEMAQTADTIVKDSRIAKGFCLVAGAADIAAELARRTALKIICVEADEAKVLAAKKLLDEAGLYGARVSVLQQTDNKLSLPDYFANLVVVADAAQIQDTELYRVLRPYGGVAYRLGAEGASWIRGDGLTASAVSKNLQKCVRGALAGAGDWTHQFANAGSSSSSDDLLVKWPLRPLWFGEPGPSRMMNRHLRGTAPVTSNGRLFVLGQNDIMAFDAYNGTELWSSRMPSAQRRVVDILGGSMASDKDSVYVCTAGLCLQFDADTGKSGQVYRVSEAAAKTSLATPQTIAVGDDNSLAMKATDSGVELTLTTKDPKVANADPEKDPAHGDSWELFFDFRPAAQRTAFYGPGVFHVIVVPATQQKPAPSWKAGPWSRPLTFKVEGQPVADGSRTVVHIAWADVVAAAAGKPDSFAFGAILNSSDDGKTLLKRDYKFATRSSYRIADFLGTATTSTATTSGTDAAPAAAPLGKLGPAENMTWGHLAVLDDVILGSVVEQTDTPDTLKFGWDFSSEGKDFTGPGVEEVLNSVGAGSGTRAIFALNKSDGKLRWEYVAKNVIPHSGICVLGNRVYVMDRPPLTQTAAERRRGKTPTDDATLVVLDLATGKKVGEVTKGLLNYSSLRGGHGILCASSMTGMTAYDASSLTELWSVNTHIPMEGVHHCTAFLRTPVVTKDWVYDDPLALQLRTGKQRLVNNKPWVWGNFRGCGTVSASASMLFFRQNNLMMLDASENPGSHKAAGIRPGCYINIIAACGLALMPEASSGCGCPYNFQATVVLAPARQ